MSTPRPKIEGSFRIGGHRKHLAPSYAVIKRIELTNFMSHEHSVFELTEGLNVLVGPNNCGKSAVVAALQILCYNDNSTYVLRHGAKQCRIRVETDDGHVVVWSRKRSGAPFYEIDGQRFDRLGKNNVPEALQEVLRLPRVQSDKEKFDVHFGEQRSPVFLLNEKAGKAADFFASSSDARHLLEMQSRHKTRVREATTRQRCLQAEAAELDARLQRLDPLDALQKSMQQLELDWGRIQRQEEQALHLHHLCQGLVESARQADGLTRRLQQLESLPAVPALVDTGPLAQLVRDLGQHTRQRECLGRREQVLQTLGSPPPLDDPQPLHDRITRIVAGRRRLNLLNRQLAWLQQTPAPPRLQDEAGLAQLLSDWVPLQQQCQQWQQQLRNQ